MSFLSLTRMRDKSHHEEPLIGSLVHSTLSCALPPMKHSDIHLETAPSPSAPVCLQKKALLIGIQCYNSTDAQLDGEDRLAARLLKGPHVDVQNMRQLLLGKAFRCYPQFPHGFLRSGHFFFGQIVMATTPMISPCLLTTAIPNICSLRKRTS